MSETKAYEYRNMHFPLNEDGTYHIADAELISIDRYTVSTVEGYGDRLRITKNGIEKTVRVEDDREYTYKLLKTKIRARDGATGLFSFMSDEFWKCAARVIMDHAIEKMKGV